MIKDKDKKTQRYKGRKAKAQKELKTEKGNTERQKGYGARRGEGGGGRSSQTFDPLF